MSKPLPRPIAWVTRRLVPAARADMVLADLEDDYGSARGRAHPRLWLLRETASLIAAYGMARFSGFVHLAPLVKRDAQLAARNLRRAPFASAAAAAMLAVGIVAVLLVTTLANTLLFRDVSSTHGDALRRVIAVDRTGRTSTRFSYLELQQIRDSIGDTGELGAVYLQPAVLRTGNADLQTMAEIVNAAYFRQTGTSMALGRPLLTIDDRLEAPPAAVISLTLWRRQFASSPEVLGTSIALNGAAFTIVGVTATAGSSSFLGASVDAWVPLAHADPIVDRDWRTTLDKRWFSVFILPAITHAAVDSQLAAAASALAATHPEAWRDQRLQTSEGTALQGSQRQGVATLVSVLGALASLILVAAASNVGSVLLARAAAQRHAVAIHLSVGSGRGAIARRQLIEGVALGAGAGVMAVALYVLARLELAEIVLLPTLALRLDVPLDLTTIASAIGGSMLAGAALAIGPAMWASRFDLSSALRESSARNGAGRRLALIRQLLVSAQVALSVVLVFSAALAVQSLAALAGADLGFDRTRVVAVDFDLEPSEIPLGELPGLAQQALAAVARLPGVAAAAMSNRAPVDQSTPTTEVEAAGSGVPNVATATVYLATADYFEVVGVPLVTGRGFVASEAAASADVVIVNEALARTLWGTGDAIGRGLIVKPEGRILRVIGVARDSKYRDLTESHQPHIYRPTPPALGRTLLARTKADPRDALRLMQRALDEIGPGLVGFFPRTLDDHLVIQLLPTRIAASVATGLGAIALCLSGTALYALISWFVALRRHEVGVRMALGASIGQVQRLVVWQALTAAAPGMAVGIALAVGGGIAARSALYGVAPADPIALGAGVGALVLVVLAASYTPSRRASRVDPASALRQ